MCKIIDFCAYKEGKEESEKYIDLISLDDIDMFLLDDFEEISDDNFDILF